MLKIQFLWTVSLLIRDILSLLHFIRAEVSSNADRSISNYRMLHNHNRHLLLLSRNQWRTQSPTALHSVHSECVKRTIGYGSTEQKLPSYWAVCHGPGGSSPGCVPWLRQFVARLCAMAQAVHRQAVCHGPGSSSPGCVPWPRRFVAWLCAMAQAVRRQPLTAVAQVGSQPSQYEACGGQSVTATGFSRVPRSFFLSIIPPFLRTFICHKRHVISYVFWLDLSSWHCSLRYILGRTTCLLPVATADIT